MEKVFKTLLIVFLVGLIGFLWPVSAVDPVEDLQKEIDELTHLREMSEQATAPLEAELEGLENKIQGIRAELLAADRRVLELQADIQERSDKLVGSYRTLSARVRDYYKYSRTSSPLVTMLASANAPALSRRLSYQSAIAEDNRATIVQMTQELLQLEGDKKQVENRKVALASLREQFEEEASFFEGEIAGAKDYQQELTSKIAELSARQQEILSQKSGTFQTTVGDVPLADDPASRPDYNPGFSPAFAAFSFGAPHYKGMSQYGAFGRAKSGNQGAEEILRAYYGSGIEIKKDYPNKEIGVAGYGRMPIEDYVKRIYEVPNSWGDEGGMEALRAQAVAARSYALAWTREGTGGNICTDQGCQVFKSSPKGGNWEQAVNATSGWVVMKDGKILSTWYASTSGGYQESYNALDYLKDGSRYNTPGFWDTPSGRGGWTSEAWESKAGSPWFYKGWYKTRSGDSCGRSHPWLTSEEMADILNAWVVLHEGGGDSERIVPEGSCWDGNPYSKDELRNIGGFSSVSGASVVYSNNGVTSSVTFDTNKGSKTISGAEFKKTFNLRAPGYVALKSGLFNIEKK